MSSALQIRLLGDFSLASDGRQIEGINTPRLQSLLAYLVLHRDTPQLRQHLAFMFWPDSSEAQALNNLRQLVHTVRRTLPDVSAFLSVDNRTLQWRRDLAVDLDVDGFERALHALTVAESQKDFAALHAAGEQLLEIYHVDLLPGCYDDWVIPERERLRDLFLQALERLISAHEARHEFKRAIRYARRMIRADPLNEGAYRALMRLYALTGDYASAYRAFQTCADTLRRQLGIEPSQATQDLHQRLRQLEAEHASDDDAPTMVDAAPRGSSATPIALIGRQREWEILRQAWQTATTQGPGFVLIAGEPGIGKSRLAEEMAQWAAHEGATVAFTRSYAVEGRLSFAPVIEWLRGPALRPCVRQLERVWLIEIARILPELLAEYPDLPHYEPMTEYGQRLRFFQALALAVLAAPQPLLLVLDDLQWCDQETLEWLHFLLRFDPHARMLILGSARSEETHPHHPLHTLLLHLRHTVAVTELSLQPLDAAETAELAARMADRDLDTDAAMRLFGETEGNPLFVVEAVRAGLDDFLKQRESAENALFAHAHAHRALPTGMRTVIADRLAQLSAPARELVALAATIGREFSLDILAEVSQSDEGSVVRALDELWQRGIVREQGPATYDFTHDKLREVAYAEISAPQRHLWHRRIASALEAVYSNDLDPVSGQIAMHYEHGGSIQRAISYYRRAALVAQRVFGHEDAIYLLRHCLDLLEQTPSSTTRDKQELAMLLALAPIYRITRGWTAPELERVVERALALCDIVGDDVQRAEALYGLQSLLVVQAQLERVQLVAEELQALYERTRGEAPPLSGMMFAGARLHLGRLSEANEAFERILTTHDTQQVESLQESQGWNFAVHTRAWRSHGLWALGYPAQAIASGVEAVQLALQMKQPFNQALAATYLAMLCQISCDTATARTRAEEAAALTVEYKAPYYSAWAAILVSYMQASEHPDEAHIAALRASIESFKATGARLRLSYFLSLLARVYHQAGHPEDGLRAIDDALAHSRRSNERWWDAELHRLRGEFMFASSQSAHDAEAALQRAADIARGQQSRSLELRALLSLARLQHAEGRAEVTCHALRDLYSWFTEGLDLPDLQAAKEFLATCG